MRPPLPRRRRHEHEQVFTEIARTRAWGDDESVSGPGSGLARTATLRAQLPELLSRLGVRTMLDAGCGDHHWMQAVDLPVQHYIGVDVVAELVEQLARDEHDPRRRFVRADITRDRLPDADFVLCREVLFHFPDRDVTRALRNLRRTGARWILTTSFREHLENPPIPVGSWRPLNLEAPPFGFPPPEEELPDMPLVPAGQHAGKRLCLWRLDELPLGRALGRRRAGGAVSG